MAKKNGNTETVPTEVETNAAAVEVAEVEQPTETTIPEPIETETVVEEIKSEEVVAEQPKPVEPIAVVTTVQRKTAPNQRRYKLIRRPSVIPKGNQRRIVLHLLMEAHKAGKTDISAAEMVDDARRLNYQATAETVLSIQWHLHQMKLAQPPYVVVTNETYEMAIEQSTTLAEATLSNDEIDAQIAKLQALKK